MDTDGFFSKHEVRLSDFTELSLKAGSRSDYVQGGGGNTSCKLDERLMAIKASGFRLDQVSPGQGYAVLDYSALRDFYQKTDPAALDDVEKQGSAQAAAATAAISGLPALRPSVEAGFHSLLGTFVLHTHSVYANLAACSSGGRDMIRMALKDLDVPHAYVPYINPGAQLTFAIGAAVESVKAAAGRMPPVIFLENHGLIVTQETAAGCLELNDQVNERIARAFGTSTQDWADVHLLAAEPAGGRTSAEPADRWISGTSWLKERLLKMDWDLDFFIRQALYPDQIVFLNGQVRVEENKSLADALAAGDLPAARCTLFRRTGEAFYQCGFSEAKTIEETICAIMFIHEKVRKAGLEIKTMNEAGKDFIRNWESEQYRRQVAGRS